MDGRRWWKLWSKEVAARALTASGFSRVNRAAQRARLGGRRFRIVSYHRVVADFAAEARRSIPGLLVSRETMRRQLQQLTLRYDVVPLARALREMRSSPGGSDLAAVTFDDGYADLREQGLDVLSGLRVPATFFLVTGLTGGSEPLPHDRLYAALLAFGERGRDPRSLPPSAGREWLCSLLAAGCRPPELVDGLIAALPDPQLAALASDLDRLSGAAPSDVARGSRLLSWAMAQELLSAGLTVGAHTVHHRVLTHLPASEARRELRESRQAILERLGVEPAGFAYPNGWYSDPVVAEAMAAGYRCAVTTEARHNGPGDDPFRLGRFTLWEGSTLGPRGYSASIASCQLDGTFEALGIPRVLSGRVAVATGGGVQPLRTGGSMLTVRAPES